MAEAQLGFDELLECLRVEYERLRDQVEIAQGSARFSRELGSVHSPPADPSRATSGNSQLHQLLFSRDVQTAGDKQEFDKEHADRGKSVSNCQYDRPRPSLAPGLLTLAPSVEEHEEDDVVGADASRHLKDQKSCNTSHHRSRGEELEAVDGDFLTEIQHLAELSKSNHTSEADGNKPRRPSQGSEESPREISVASYYGYMLAKQRPTYFKRFLNLIGKHDEDLDPFRDFVKKKRLRCSLVRKLVKHPVFQAITSMIIMANILVLVAESDAAVKEAFADQKEGLIAGEQEPGEFFAVAEYIFVVFFAVELCLRMIAEELLFFFGDNVRWNVFDAGLVLLSFIPSEQMKSGVDANVARLLRVLRMSRALRIVRVFEAFHELRIMMDSIIHVIFPLFWSVLTLSLVIVMFSLVFLSAVKGFLEDENRLSAGTVQGDDEDSYLGTVVLLQPWFESAPMTFLSLFMCLTNGQSWWVVMEPLLRISWIYAAIFVVFVIFLQLGVLNIITSIFVSYAAIKAQSDLDMIAMASSQKQEDAMKQFRKVFDLLDADGSGAISLTEFDEWAEDPKVSAFFEQVLGLETWKVGKFFRLLDVNGDNMVARDEFVVGCMRLKSGGTATVDQEVLSYNVRTIKIEMRELKEVVARSVQLFLVSRRHQAMTRQHQALTEASKHDSAPAEFETRI